MRKCVFGGGAFKLEETEKSESDKKEDDSESEQLEAKSDEPDQEAIDADEKNEDLFVKEEPPERATEAKPSPLKKVRANKTD